MNKYLDIHPEVAHALKHHLPVVALESTIISHGMPYPKNVETALLAEQTVRNEGAIPATIAIVGGKLKVGLTPDEIDTFGKKGLSIIKVSRRDIPYVLSQGLDGATTVSATMIIAALAGIQVFATGGIGGVHRGASTTMDISADLDELAMTSVAVVCAGAKSILDIGLTLEYLETKGVPVIGYQSDTLPAFYTDSSDFLVPLRLDNPNAIARLLRSKWELGLKGGAVIANPIPKTHAMDKAVIESVIQEAIADMNRLGITGKETTPYLLSRIEQITSGKSLEANIALVLNNCKLASQIAIHLFSNNS